MSPLGSREACLFVLLTALATACSGREPGPVAFDDYPGEAFPNRRPSFEPEGRRLGYVPNRESDTISVLDLDEMKLLGSVPVGRDPVDIDGPRHLVLDREQGLAYVALSYPNLELGAHAISLGQTARSGYIEALELSDLRVAGDLRLDPSTWEVAFAPATGMLAVTHYDTNRATLNTGEARRASLVLLETPSAIATGEAKPRRIPVCAVPSALAFNADASRVFVACTGDDVLAVVDTARREVTSRVPVGTSPANKPTALTGDASRERLLISNEVSGAVTMFDMADPPELLATFQAPARPRFATWLSDSRILVPHQYPSGVSLFDAETSELLLDVQYADEECLNPAEVSLTSDARLLLVCQAERYLTGAVVELDPETLSILSRVEVERYPERLTIYEP